MKRLVLFFLSAVCVFSMSACVNKGSTAPTIVPAVTASGEAALPAASASSAQATESPAQASPSATQSSSIIAESSNAVSDKEKEAILSDLSAQLDNAFNDSQDLDDLDNSDLDTNNIN